MGGKDAIIVDGEADLESAVAGVVQSAFGYQGQKCSACSRAIVDESVYDEFLEKLQATRGRRSRSARPRIPANYMGPVISAGARKTHPRLHRDRQEAKARLLVSRRRSAVRRANGYFVSRRSSRTSIARRAIFQEEIFGPVLAVTRARDFDHALELANDTEYGLTGAVYTSNPEKVRRAREEFFVGNLYINRKCTGAMVGAHPFGGFNMSGTDSKAGGPDYLLQFLQAKSIGEKL